MTRHPMFAKRPTAYCDLCESTVYTDDIHSCHDAKAVRAQQERERTLTALERAVVEAAVAWRELERIYDALESGAIVEPKEEREARFRADLALNELRATVQALNATRTGEG